MIQQANLVQGGKRAWQRRRPVAQAPGISAHRPFREVLVFPDPFTKSNAHACSTGQPVSGTEPLSGRLISKVVQQNLFATQDDLKRESDFIHIGF